MKKLTLTSVFLTIALSVSAVTFSGIASTNITGAVTGSSSYVIVDTNNDGLAFDGSVAGDTFTLNSFVGTSDDYVIGYNAVASSFAVSILSGRANFTLDTNGVSANDAFYIVTFGSETTASVTAIAGLGFNVFTAENWLVPGANGDVLTYPANFTQFDSQNLTAQTVAVSEPFTIAALAGLQIEYQPSGGETSSVPWQELYGSDGYAQFGFSGSVIERIPYTYAQGVVTYTIFDEEIRLSFETATSGTYEYVELDGADLFVDEVGTFSIVVAPTLEVKTDDWQRSETMDSPLSTDYWNTALRTVDGVEYNAGELSFIFANGGEPGEEDYPEIEIEYGRTLPLDENWQVVLDDLYASPSVSNFRIGFDLSLLDSDTEVGCYFNYGDYGFGGRQVNADVERRGDTYVYRAGAFVRANQDARLQGGVNLRVRHNAASRDLLFEYQPDGASGWTELARLNLGDGTFAGTNQYGDGVAPISGEVLSASERFAMDVEVEAGQATQLGDLEIAGIEIGSYTPPPSIDTDGDGLADDVETDTGVYISANDTGTNPYIPDTDGDGLNDGDEVNIHGSSPIDSDSDDDTILDGIEVRHATFGFDPAVDSSARLAEFIAAAEELPGVITDAQNEGLSLGGVSLTPDGGNSLSVAFVIEESEDLTSWTTVETISHSLDTSGTKKFVRVRKPE